MARGKIISVSEFNGKGKDGKAFTVYNGACEVEFGDRKDTVLFSVFKNGNGVPLIGAECELHDFRADRSKETGAFLGAPKYRSMYIVKDNHYLKV